MPSRFRSIAAHRFVIAAAVASVLCFIASPSSLRAQSGRDLAIQRAEARDADTQRELEMKRFEDMRAKANAPGAHLAFAQIGDDFKQMQIVNNEMMRATFAGSAPHALDYERISKATAEINRRAARLRTNLQLPAQAHDDSHATEQEIASEKELRSSLLSLDGLIMGFVNNPTFNKQNVLDAQHAARASSDLLNIIKLSQKIKQRAEKMKG